MKCTFRAKVNVFSPKKGEARTAQQKRDLTVGTEDPEETSKEKIPKKKARGE